MYTATHHDEYDIGCVHRTLNNSTAISLAPSMFVSCCNERTRACDDSILLNPNEVVHVRGEQDKYPNARNIVDPAD